MTQAAAPKPVKRPVAPYLKLSANAADGVLTASRCQKCGVTHLGAPAVCLACMSPELKPVELSKEGELHSYTVIHAPPAGWTGPVPYALGAVRLPEGPNILAEVIDCPFEQFRIGMKMQLMIAPGGKDKDGNEVMVYKWRPAGK